MQPEGSVDFCISLFKIVWGKQNESAGEPGVGEGCYFLREDKGRVSQHGFQGPL